MISETNNFLKKRKNLRKEILVKTIQNNTNKERKSISTMDIYHYSFDKGYSYCFSTLNNDLKELQEEKKLSSMIVYDGKMIGTRTFWSVKE